MDDYTSSFLQAVRSERKRATYDTSIRRMREVVEGIWRSPQHRYFTDHSITHSERILRYLWPLTRPCQPVLSDSEIYILVAAAYLHDIGMQSEKLGPDFKENRRIHQELSVEMIETLDLGVLPPYKDDISLVVRAHRHVPLDADEYEGSHLDDDPVRPRLLGSLLRLADELELTHERVDLTRRNYQNPGLDALVHWYRHEYVRSVTVDGGTKRIQILYRFPKERRDECAYAVAEYVQGVIDDTLREINTYVWNAQAAFRLESPDIRESPNASPLPDDVLNALRLEADARIREREEHNMLSSATSTNDDLLKAIRDAESRESAGQALDAAARFLAIARRFLRGKQYMRAADYAQRAADHYKAANDRRAGEALLLTAQAHFDRDDPGVGRLPAEEALQLAQERSDREAQMHAHAMLGAVYHLLVDGRAAEMHLRAALQLSEALRRDGGTVREPLLVAIHDGLARVALLDDDWDSAAAHLTDGLAEVSELPSRLRLLVRLANIYLEVGRGDDAAPAVTEALSLVNNVEDATLQAGIHACAGHLAALRDDTDTVIAQYDTAIGLLAGHGQEPYAATLYLEKHAFVLHAGITGVREDVAFEEQATRIDLARERLHPVVDAQRLQLEGAAAAVDRRVPDALQAYTQALTIYRQYGAFEELRTALRRCARLYEQADRVDRALALYARVGAVEDVGRVADVCAQQVGSAEEVEGLIRALTVSQTDPAQAGRARAYGILADIVPDGLVPGVIDDLLSMVRKRDSAAQDISVRRAAIEALPAFSRRVPDDRLAAVIETCLTVPRESSWWTTEQSAIRGVARIVGERATALPTALAARATSALLDKAATESFDELRDAALWATYVVARHVGGEQRAAVVSYLQNKELSPMIAAYLAALDAPPSPQRLYETVIAILGHIGYRRVETEWGPGVAHGGYTPGIFDYFGTHLTPSCMTAILEHFIRGVGDAENPLRLRAAMLVELGNLADLIADEDIAQCYDILSRACRGDVPVGERDAMHIETTRNAFSRFRIDTGTVAEIAGAAAWSMAWLSHRLSDEQRVYVVETLRALADLDDAALRRDVARAMGELRQLDTDEWDRLRVTLAVLLRDPEPNVQFWMVQSIVRLYERNALDMDGALIERILKLGTTSTHRDVRRAVAYALRRLPIVDRVPDLSGTAEEARIKLEMDVDFGVRTELVGQDEDEAGPVP